MKLFRTKTVLETKQTNQGLKRCLSLSDLIFLGIGITIGAGIFIMTGIAASTAAGPGIMLSYVIASLACFFTAAAYAELASCVGGCGSAYGYSYLAFGELIAWIIGWDLLFEYGISAAAVSIGWSSYINNILADFGIHLPVSLLHGPTEGGLVNLPAMAIIFGLSVILAIGVQQSARFNKYVVVIKLLAIALFIAIACSHFNAQNWHPFMPFAWHGVIQGAALIFFAYIGFDALSTTAEEALQRKRDLPICILATLGICTVIYVVVSGLLTGITSYTTLNTASPVADVLSNLGHRFAAAIIAVGAIAGLTTVLLATLYGLSRIIFAIARDGLLPSPFVMLHKTRSTPITAIFFAGLIIALVAGVVPIATAVELVNIGTLSAFIIVCIGVLVLRYRKPNLERKFKTPFGPVFPLLGIIFCLYLISSLPEITIFRFFAWLIIGLVIYAVYGYRNSVLSVET